MSKANTRAIIDANIRQNGRQLITGQVLNAVLNSMVTDYAEQAALDDLKEKVDALALGAFYGYFPDSDSLPTDVTTPGYAYVGTDNPYEIWNFNGESWSDSGTSIDQNDADEEDITRNAAGKLQFKDRVDVDGMGYVILRQGKDLADQMTLTNTIYEVRYNFNLNGGNLSIPSGSILKFNGGKILNGNVTFNNTTIDADGEISVFENVEISGSLVGDVRYAHWFKYGTNHDDWKLISTLFTRPGIVHLESRVYNLDKLVHTSVYISLSDNLSVIGCDGCVFSANYTGATNYDTLFDISQKRNISFSDIKIDCVIGTTMPPPAGHGSTWYASSGVYAFVLNDYCSNVRLHNINFNNVGYAMKSTNHSSYTDLVYFENITITNCQFLCDMPLQGTGYANMIVKNCRIVSRGMNTGNHALYLLPNRNAAYNGNRSLYFENCYIYSHRGDGQIVQIYSASDTAIDNPTTTYFNDCILESEGRTAITASESANIIMNNCVLKAASEASMNTYGRIIAYDSKFYNVIIYQNMEAHGCYFDTTQLIVGDNSAVVPVIIDDSEIHVSQYVIYNNVDAAVPVINRCKIFSEGDGLITQRGNQVVPVVFVGCDISVRGRLAYCPGKSTLNTISLINCSLESRSPSYTFTTNSDNAKLNIVNCTFNGDTINMPTAPRNSGTTRPSYGVGVGQAFFDTNLGKPIFWTGSKWVDATGADA